MYTNNKHVHDEAARQAVNMISSVNDTIKSGRIKNARNLATLEAMRSNAYDTLRNMSNMERNAGDYRGTSVGYAYSNTNDMDGNNRVIPHLNDDDDDNTAVNMPRFRSATTGRFLPNTYRSQGGRAVRVRPRNDYDGNNYNDMMDTMYNMVSDLTQTLNAFTNEMARSNAANRSNALPNIPPVMHTTTSPHGYEQQRNDYSANNYRNDTGNDYNRQSNDGRGRSDYDRNENTGGPRIGPRSSTQ